MEQEASVLKGEVRALRGKLGLDTEAPVVGPIGGQGSGGAVISVSMQERVGTPLLGGGHADSPGMSHRSLNSMGPGDEDEDDEMDLGSSKKRRKVGGRGGNGDGASEEEMLQLKEQLRGYQAMMRVMQEEISMLKGKKPSVSRSPACDPIQDRNRWLTMHTRSITVHEPTSLVHARPFIGGRQAGILYPASPVVRSICQRVFPAVSPAFGFRHVQRPGR